MSRKRIVIDKKIDAELNSNIPISSNETRVNVETSKSNINTDIPIASNTNRINIDVPTSNINTNIPIASDNRNIARSYESVLNADISIASDNRNISRSYESVLNADIPTASDSSIAVPQTRADLSIDFPITESVPLERFELSLAKGQWLPKGDPIAIGATNFSELENFRYTDFGVEGIGGFTEINTTEHWSDFTNGAQLRTNYTRNSYVLMQGTYSGTRYIVENTATIPNTGNFLLSITATNNILYATHSVEGVKTCTVATGVYTQSNLATQIETAMDAQFIVECTVTYNEATRKFTISVATGTITFDYDYANSIATTIGFTADPTPALSVTSDTEVNRVLYTENAAATIARFAQLPNRHIGICDGYDDLIWASDEMPVGAFLECPLGTSQWFYDDSLSDYTDSINNTDTSDVVSIDAGTVSRYFLGSTRPLSGMYINVGTPNSAASTLAVLAWDGNSFETVTPSDGTSNGTNTLAQDGWVTWTTGTPKPFLMSNYYLYFYQIYPSASTSTTLINITLRADIQNVIDIWDGVLRTCILAMKYDASIAIPQSKLENYTLEIAEPSFSYISSDLSDESTVSALPIVSSGTSWVAANDYLYIMFEEPCRGFKIDLKGYSDDVANFQVSYRRNDNTWVDIGVYRDTTTSAASGGITLSHSGYISIGDVITDEIKTTIENVTGYCYKITFSQNLAGVYIYLDSIYGIPKSRTINNNYKFPFKYKNRAMWCSSQSDKEYNRVDYSKANAPDVYNGEDSSGYFNERSLYFSGSEPLIGAVELFNQYGDNAETVALFFKNTELYMLTGDNSEDFRILPVSHSVGCPAPLTITSAEVSYKALDAPAQNIAMWLSDKGPMMFINNTIRAIPGVENYFESVDSSTTIDTDNISKASAWFDSAYQEWNLLIPVGTTQTTNNRWLVYDLRRSKWYEKIPNSYTDTLFPQGAFPVQDQYGIQYIYGFNNGGYLLRMENGLAWGTGGSTVQNKWTSSDFFFTGSTWDRTRLRRLVSMFKVDSNGNVTVTYYRNTKTSIESVSALPSSHSMSLTYHRVRHLISYLNLTAWTHRLSYLFASCSSTKPVFLGLAAMWERDTEELTNMIEIGSNNDRLILNTNEQGNVNLDVTVGLYAIDVAVQVLEDAINASPLTLQGTITYTCSINSDRKLVIDAGTSNTVKYTHSGSDGGTTWGFTANQGPSQTITSNSPIA